MDALVAANTVPLPQLAAAPAGTPGYPTDGNPDTGALQTDLPAYHYAGMMLEILHVIDAAGLARDRGNLSQLLTAIQALVAGPNAEEARLRVAGDEAETQARIDRDAAEAQARIDNDAAEAAARTKGDTATLGAAATDAQTRAGTALASAKSYSDTYAVSKAGDTVSGPLYSFTYYTCGPNPGNYHPCTSASIGVTISQQTISAYNSFGSSAEFGTGTAQSIINFFCAGNVVGSVYNNGNSVSFNTSSDYRLKVNVSPITDAIARVKSVPARQFAWSSDVIEGGPDPKLWDGFLAHEAAAGVPDAVTGAKDQVRISVDAVVGTEGNVLDEGITAAQFGTAMALPQPPYPVGSRWTASTAVPAYQAIDLSKMVPVLWAAVQDLADLVEAQAQAIAALKQSAGAAPQAAKPAAS